MMNKIKPMIPEDPTKRKIYYIKLQIEKDERELDKMEGLLKHGCITIKEMQPRTQEILHNIVKNEQKLKELEK